MCNQAYAHENKVAVLAICSCFATFHVCDDDIKDARTHQYESMVNSPNHRWIYINPTYSSNEADYRIVDV